MFKDYNSFEKEKLVHIYLPPYNFNDGLTIDGFPEVNSDIEKVNSDPDSYIYINSVEIPEHSLTFTEYFTLNEIEKIKNITVQGFDILQVLRKEQQRLEQMEFVEMDAGHHDAFYYNLAGTKYDYNQDLFNGKKIVALIEYKKDWSLIKVYDTKTMSGCTSSFESLNNRPAILYYVPNNKIFKKIKFNELPSDFRYQYN